MFASFVGASKSNLILSEQGLQFSYCDIPPPQGIQSMSLCTNLFSND